MVLWANPVRPLCVLVTGDPVEAVRAERGDFAALVRQTVGSEWGGPWRDVDARARPSLPAAGELAGVIVTGSAASVTERASWMLESEAWLRALVAAELPVLGICFGHQLLGQALGGEVRRNPRGYEVGTVEVELLAEDELLPSGERPALASMTHLDSVTALPPGARVLARTALEPHAVVRFAPSALGVQFHPELDGAAIRAYVQARRARIEEHGLDWQRLHEDTRDAPFGASVLRRFARHLGRRRG